MTINLKLRNNSNPKSVSIIHATGSGKSTLDNAAQDDLLHWCGALPTNRPLTVVANVITDGGETRFFVENYKVA